MNDKADNDDDGLVLDQFLCFAIYSAGHAFNQFYRPVLDEIGLTYPQYLVMVSLWSRDGQTVKELGLALYLESNTLTPMLKRMEAMGLVTRTRDPADERQVCLRLTDAGKALRKQAAQVPACVTQALGMSAERIRALTRDVSAVRNLLSRGEKIPGADAD